MTNRDLAGFAGEQRVFQLGRVTVNFQYCETVAAFLVWHLIPTDQATGAAITSQLSFDRLMTVFQLLAERKFARSQSLVDELKAVTLRLSQLEQKRNVLVHSSWAADDAGVVSRFKVTATRKKGVQVQSPETDASEIMTIADALGSTGRDLMALARKARAEGLFEFPTSGGPPSAAP